MSEPTRWSTAGSDAPEGARELLGALAAPHPMPREVRSASAARVARLVTEPAPARLFGAIPLVATGAGVGVLATAAVLGLAYLSPEAEVPTQHVAELSPVEMSPIEQPGASPSAAAVPAAVESAESEPQPEPEPEAEPDPEPAPQVAPDVDPPVSNGNARRPARHARGAARRNAPATRGPEGRLTITTNPWARVYVDGRLLGTTPLREIDLPAGRHRLELRLANGQVAHQTVRIQADRTTVTRHAFGSIQFGMGGGSGGNTAQATGRIMINTTPWARVSVDGRSVGNTPISNLRVAPGVHRLTLTPSDGSQHTFTVRVQAGETTRIVRRLPTLGTTGD